MKILVACEESQSVTKELRALGHEAYSCDIVPCTGGHPEWHYERDVFEVIDNGWDMMIAFPPCTYLAVSGARWLYHPEDNHLDYKDRRPHPKHLNRRKHQREGLAFVQKLMDERFNSYFGSADILINTNGKTINQVVDKLVEIELSNI